MNYKATIGKCTDYIKDHISREITAEELAGLCGYSLYHLSSVFRACFGCSIGRYIQEEKMREAARRLRQGQKITEIAYDIGFDTGSGFTKAFRRQFGVPPREYRSLTLQPEFVKRSDLRAYGYVIPVEEGHSQAGQAAFWSHVNFKDLPSYPENASDYAEISAWIDPDAKTGKMEYFFGYITSDPNPAEGFRCLSLSGGEYAIFRLEYLDGGISQELLLHIQSVWHYIFEEWFASHPQTNFDDSRLCFEKYGQKEIEICVPVRY